MYSHSLTKWASDSVRHSLTADVRAGDKGSEVCNTSEGACVAAPTTQRGEAGAYVLGGASTATEAFQLSTKPEALERLAGIPQQARQATS